MGAKQSKRSVDISGKEADGAGEVAVAGAGGEGRMEPLADADALKPQQINGDAHIHEEDTAKEKQLEIGTPENEKDATTEKESKEQDNEKEKEGSPVTNGDPEPKENGESTPADGKKPKKEKVKKKFSLRSISFSRKDKPKQDKKQKEPKTFVEPPFDEPEKEPREATDVITPETVQEILEEAKSETEIKDEKTPETPVTEPLTNGTSTPETPKVESPAADEPVSAPASVPAPVPVPAQDDAKPEVKVAPEPEQLPVNGLSLNEPKSESSEISHTEESKPSEPIESTETAPVPEIPVNKEVCVVALSVETPPPPLPANPPPSAVASFAVTTMALDVDASLLNTTETPSTTSLGTGDDIVVPQILSLESSNEKTHPISILKVLDEKDKKESIIQEVICKSTAIPTQIERKQVQSDLEIIQEPDLIGEPITTSQHSEEPQKTEISLVSESEAKVFTKESIITKPLMETSEESQKTEISLISEQKEVLLNESIITKPLFESNEAILGDEIVDQNGCTSESEMNIPDKNFIDSHKPLIVNNIETVVVENVVESILPTTIKKSIEDSKQISHESDVEPITDIMKQTDYKSLSAKVSEQPSVDKVLNTSAVEEVEKIEEVAEQLTDNKPSIEQTISEVKDKHVENKGSYIENITECILDNVEKEVANVVTIEDIRGNSESLSLDNIPRSIELVEANEPELKVPEDMIPLLPEPCEIPLPEPIIESLEASVVDLPLPPPPIEETLEIETKSTSLKSEVVKETSDLVVELTDNVLIQNAINGNGKIDNDDIDDSNKLLRSAECNGADEVATSVAPAQPLQEPLPMSDKIADLIPEIPVVPDSNTETFQETSTNMEVDN